jgi:hypothetical protein
VRRRLHGPAKPTTIACFTTLPFRVQKGEPSKAGLCFGSGDAEHTGRGEGESLSCRTEAARQKHDRFAQAARSRPPTWARELRSKWMRQRRQMAPSALVATAFSPSWTSKITSLTPRRRRRVSEEVRPEDLGFRRADGQARISRRP